MGREIIKGMDVCFLDVFVFIFVKRFIKNGYVFIFRGIFVCIYMRISIFVCVYVCSCYKD